MNNKQCQAHLAEGKKKKKEGRKASWEAHFALPKRLLKRQECISLFAQKKKK